MNTSLEEIIMELENKVMETVGGYETDLILEVVEVFANNLEEYSDELYQFIDEVKENKSNVDLTEY